MRIDTSPSRLCPEPELVDERDGDGRGQASLLAPGAERAFRLVDDGVRGALTFRARAWATCSCHLGCGLRARQRDRLLAGRARARATPPRVRPRGVRVHSHAVGPERVFSESAAPRAAESRSRGTCALAIVVLPSQMARRTTVRVGRDGAQIERITRPGWARTSADRARQPGSWWGGGRCGAWPPRGGTLNPNERNGLERELLAARGWEGGCLTEGAGGLVVDGSRQRLPWRAEVETNGRSVAAVPRLWPRPWPAARRDKADTRPVRIG